jgi:heptosyltransferase-2
MQTKKIFIEIPTWLGDAVMTTPAIENICAIYPDCHITIFGSNISCTLFKYHNNVKKIIIDNSKNSSNRFLNLYKLASTVKNMDLAFSFRKNFTTKFLMFFIQAKEKFIYKRYTKKEIHQVIRYNDFVNNSLNTNTNASNLSISLDKDLITIKKPKRSLGINPGATYGSAKRWYPEEFAKVAIELSTKYDIIIFGGPGEVDIAQDIENEIQKHNITNYVNKAGKTSVEELIREIASLDLFVTADSGPMHIAAAFDVKTISIFGPTKYTETSQWMNQNSYMVNKHMECAPCMKRVCPLKGDEHHLCMKQIKAHDIIKEINDNRI